MSVAWQWTSLNLVQCPYQSYWHRKLSFRLLSLSLWMGVGTAITNKNILWHACVSQYAVGCRLLSKVVVFKWLRCHGKTMASSACNLILSILPHAAWPPFSAELRKTPFGNSGSVPGQDLFSVRACLKEVCTNFSYPMTSQAVGALQAMAAKWLDGALMAIAFDAGGDNETPLLWGLHDQQIQLVGFS